MKKAISFLCVLMMIAALAACSNNSSQSTSITGQVTAIEGETVTLSLGTLEEMEMPEGESGQQPASLPEDNSGTKSTAAQNGDNSSNTPPTPPTGSDTGAQTPPSMPSDGSQPTPQTNSDGSMPTPQTNSDGSMPTPPSDNGSMPNGQEGGMAGFTASGETKTISLSGAKIVVENRGEQTEGTTQDITVGSIIVVEMGSGDTAVSVTVKSGKGKVGGFNMPGGGSTQVEQGTAATTISEDTTQTDTTYTSAGNDENALRVDGATVTLDGITVNKSGGSSSNTEFGDFYGMNAALLATAKANVTIKSANISSAAQNGNGVFSYGEGTVVNISDSTINTTADNSGGIQTTGGATTNAADLIITTAGNSSAAIRSDRGGGTVNVDGGSYTTKGYNSPAVYSTAAITVKNASLTAANSEALVIEGKNSIVLENCNVSGNMSDDKGTSSNINVHNVMIYQSMSGDADVGTSSLSMTGGSLTNNNGDMFFATNTHCILTLSGVNIINNEQNGYFLLVSGNDASNSWGSAGSNGAQMEFTAKGQTIAGNIAVDKISTLKMSLTENSTLTGAVNIIDNAQGGTAVSDNAVITVEAGSTWNLTGNSTVSSLTNNGTINYNGYTITLADGTVLKG